jgi:hypothetical protein
MKFNLSQSCLRTYPSLKLKLGKAQVTFHAEGYDEAHTGKSSHGVAFAEARDFGPNILVDVAEWGSFGGWYVDARAPRQSPR